MVDNVLVTPGVGESIAADEVTRGGLEKQQIVKQAIGGEGAFEFLVGESGSLEHVQPDISTIALVHVLLIAPASPVLGVEIYNAGTRDVIISFDAGVTDHFYIPASSGFSRNFLNIGKTFGADIHWRKVTSGGSGLFYATLIE